MSSRESKKPDAPPPDGSPPPDSLVELAGSIGHVFGDPDLLRRALVHRSWCAEHPGYRSNERLEFLGDAALGLVVADLTFRRFADLAEGQLTDVRKAVVNAHALAEVARELGLGPHVRLGRGEEATGGADKTSILSDTLEAVIGAIYLDADLAAAAAFIERVLDARIAEAVEGLGTLDHKTTLQELAVDRFDGPPVYEVVASGPDHDKHFEAVAVLDGTRYGQGAGRSKKAAQQAAAAATLAMLEHAADGAVDGTADAASDTAAPDGSAD